jgi:mRNA interferase MazF
MIRRGGVWWTDLGIPRGSAPGLRRPVVVIGSDRYNESRLATATVVVLTTNLKLAALPGNVLLPTAVSGLPEDSVANVTQITTLDRDDLVEEAGTLPAWVMDDLDDGLRRALAL